MRFETIVPTEQLKPYIRYFAISENELEHTYKVLPNTGLVAGIQYRGQLCSINNDDSLQLAHMGITGISDTFKIFQNTGSIGTILIYFTETGFTAFTTVPANELFNQSISLHHIFSTDKLRETEDKLGALTTNRQRIDVVQDLLLSQLKEYETDRMVAQAVQMIQRSQGTIKIKELCAQLYTSPSPLEKRFRKIVGASPKKFASITRFNTILANMKNAGSLTKMSYANDFFDQSHFIKDFRRFTGDTPENFRLTGR